MEAFFFPSGSERLFGVFRGSKAAERVWILCPPFAEEEKSTRRVFTEIALTFLARGQASLVFSLRGTGDSSGDFSRVTFADWRADLRAASAYAQSLAPNAKIGVLGVRLGASLALLERDHADCLCLIEPILNGKTYLGQHFTRKKLRAQIGGANVVLPDDDLDGWPLGTDLRADLEALNLSEIVPFGRDSWVYSIGPRSEVPPPLAILAATLGGVAEAIVMPAFWNLLDYQKPTPLLEKLGGIYA